MGRGTFLRIRILMCKRRAWSVLGRAALSDDSKCSEHPLHVLCPQRVATELGAVQKSGTGFHKHYSFALSDDSMSNALVPSAAELEDMTVGPAISGVLAAAVSGGRGQRSTDAGVTRGLSVMVDCHGLHLPALNCTPPLRPSPGPNQWLMGSFATCQVLTWKFGRP